MVCPSIYSFWLPLNNQEYVPLAVNTSRSFPYSWLITGFVTRITRRVPKVEQELLTLPEHSSLLPVFSEVRVTRSLILCACFVDRCLFSCPFSVGHCVVCSPILITSFSGYGFFKHARKLTKKIIHEVWLLIDCCEQFFISIHDWKKMYKNFITLGNAEELSSIAKVVWFGLVYGV